jgi:hypothetical protein
MANGHGFSFEDCCVGGHFYAVTPLQYFSTCRYVAVIHGFRFFILINVDRLYGIATQEQQPTSRTAYEILLGDLE